MGLIPAWRMGLCAAIAIGCCASAPAATMTNLLEFLTQPSSSNTSEFVLNPNGNGGLTLVSGPGSNGTGFIPGAASTPGSGDGEDPLDQQDTPGLQLVTPFEVASVPGSVVNTNNGSTTIFDAALFLTGFDTVEVADSLALPSGDLIAQSLGTGTIEIFSTDPASGGIEDDVQLLLSATVNDATISGQEGGGAGSVISTSVVYTGGSILAASGFNPGDTGEFSFSLIDIENVGPLAIDPATGSLFPFEADATGLFTIEAVIPEPSTTVLVLLGCLAGSTTRNRSSSLLRSPCR